jgi:cytoskeletal protein RodZ
MNESNASKQSSLGALLKKARVEKGLTLAQVSEKTKIGIRWLEAAENDRFDELPGMLFSKGLIRTYESFTGIKNHDLLKKFEAMEITIKGNEPKLIEDMPLHKESNVARIVWTVLCLAAFCITAMVYYFFGNMDSEPVGAILSGQYLAEKSEVKTEAKPYVEPEQEETPADMEPEMPQVEEPPSMEPVQGEEPVTVTVPAPEEVSPMVSPPPSPGEPSEPIEEKRAVELEEKPVEAVQNETETDLDQLADRSKPLALSITASTDSWLRVLVDGKIEREIILRAGKEVIWSADKNYKLSIGNVAGVSLRLNGTAIKLKQPASNIITNLKLPIAAPDESAEQ